MTGWKTILGAFIMIVAAGLEAKGYGQFCEPIMTLGVATGLIGVGHKLDKLRQ